MKLSLETRLKLYCLKIHLLQISDSILLLFVLPIRYYLTIEQKLKLYFLKDRLIQRKDRLIFLLLNTVK